MLRISRLQNSVDTQPCSAWGTNSPCDEYTQWSAKPTRSVSSYQALHLEPLFEFGDHQASQTCPVCYLELLTVVASGAFC